MGGVVPNLEQDNTPNSCKIKNNNRNGMIPLILTFSYCTINKFEKGEREKQETILKRKDCQTGKREHQKGKHGSGYSRERGGEEKKFQEE